MKRGAAANFGGCHPTNTVFVTSGPYAVLKSGPKALSSAWPRPVGLPREAQPALSIPITGEGQPDSAGFPFLNRELPLRSRQPNNLGFHQRVATDHPPLTTLHRRFVTTLSPGWNLAVT